MEAPAFERALRAWVRRVPFVPFTVELITGIHLDIQHPEALVTRGGVAIYFAPDGELTIFDHNGVSRFISETGHAASACRDAAQPN
jgi:hypothetical protein